MKFERKIKISRIKAEGDSGTVGSTIVFEVEGGVPRDLPFHVPLKSTTLAPGTQAIIGTELPDHVFCVASGRVHAKRANDYKTAVEITWFLAGGRSQSLTITVDRLAADSWHVGTEMFLWVPTPRFASGEIAAENISHAKLTNDGPHFKILTQTTWRFELGFAAATDVPPQALCQLGAIVAGSGGHISEGPEDPERSWMVFQGPGLNPPPALVQWCRDNRIQMTVRANA